jgi:hypothetical protein
MKTVIDGKTYNTDTSTTVASYSYEDGDGYDTEAVVYLNRGGAYFAVHTWDVTTGDVRRGEERETKTKTFVEVLSRAEIDRLVATENLTVHNERALTLPPEATAEDEASATIFVRVPEALKAKVDEAASTAGVSINAWALRCFEACLAKAA